MLHCSGGAQTKVLHFVENVRVVKIIFPCSSFIQNDPGTKRYGLGEMYKVFNMGHRLEVYLSPEHAEKVIAISRSFGIQHRLWDVLKHASKQINH